MPGESETQGAGSSSDALATGRVRTRPPWALIPLILGSMALVGTLPVLDAVHHGPYATWFNRRCQQLADDSGLVGGPESHVIPILGRPTFHYAGDDDSRRTYNYAPWPLLPTAKFQVHCRDGIVDSVEQFDD